MTDEPKTLWQRLRQFLLHDVWDIELSTLSAGKSLPIRLVRVAQLIIKGFTEDDLAVHASALTFVTLMSLVPMLAVGFALLKGFGFGQEQIDTLLQWKSSMPGQFQSFLDSVLNIVNTTNFAALGWVGLGFVIFTAVIMLASMEVSFNRIWGITKMRSPLRQAANYISMIVLVPLLIGAASAVEASLKGLVPILPESVSFVVHNLLRLTSFFMTWLAFWFLYMFLPNTRVRASPALISSLVGAILWLGWQKAYISLQMGVARYNAIYGTFASVPIFLAWLYMSWVIVLLGAELAFALQNAATYRMESAADAREYEIESGPGPLDRCPRGGSSGRRHGSLRDERLRARAPRADPPAERDGAPAGPERAPRRDGRQGRLFRPAQSPRGASREGHCGRGDPGRREAGGARARQSGCAGRERFDENGSAVWPVRWTGLRFRICFRAERRTVNGRRFMVHGGIGRLDIHHEPFPIHPSCL